MKFEVKTLDVSSRTIKSKSGKDLVLTEQKLWAHGLDAYPIQVRATLWGDQQPYKPGTYQLSPACFEVDRYGGLRIRLDKLVEAK